MGLRSLLSIPTSAAPTSQTVSAPATAGTAFTINRLLGSSSTLSLLSGSDGNLTLTGNTISATSAIYTGSTQTALVRESSGLLAVEYPVNLVGTAQLPATGTALPKSSAIVARWSAASLSSQANGSRIPSWNSIVGSDSAAQSDTTKQPRFYKSGVGGQPYVEFDGTNVLSFALTGAAGVAMASGKFTVQIVFQSITTNSTYGYIFNAGGYNDFAIVMPTSGVPSEIGTFPGGGTMLPIDDALFQPVGSFKGSPYGNRSMAKGTMSGTGLVANGASSGTGYIGGNPGFGLAGAKISEIIVWNDYFDQPEAIQFTKWAYEQHQQPYPWAGSTFRLWDGNSTMQGYGGAASNGSRSVPNRVAKKKGWKLGTYSFIGLSGRSLQSMLDQAPSRIDPCVALLSPTTLTVVAGEYANSSYISNVNTLTTLATQFNTARKAAGATMVYLTSTDVGDTSTSYGGNPTRRAAYNEFAWTTTGKADKVITIHLDTNVGVEGTCPASPGPYGPNFVDEVHLSEAGYNFMAEYIAASPALA